MNITEYQIFDKKATHCGHHTLLPYEYELTCISCG